MCRPKYPVHHGLSKRFHAEVVVIMPADKTERPSAFRVGPFVDPTDWILRAFNYRCHYRLGFWEEAKLEVVFIAQVVILPASADRVRGIGLAQFRSLYQVPRKPITLGIEPGSHGVQPLLAFRRL